RQCQGVSLLGITRNGRRIGDHGRADRSARVPREALMIVNGRAHVLGNDVNTDYIIASKYKAQTLDIEGMAKHVFEDLDPDLAGRIAVGDVIVAGRNFGCGSSREAAPRVLQAAGIRAVVA